MRHIEVLVEIVETDHEPLHLSSTLGPKPEVVNTRHSPETAPVWSYGLSQSKPDTLNPLYPKPRNLRQKPKPCTLRPWLTLN